MSGSGCSGSSGLDARAAAAALLFFSADLGMGAGPLRCAGSSTSSSAAWRVGDVGGVSSSDEKSPPFVAMIAVSITLGLVVSLRRSSSLL